MKVTATSLVSIASRLYLKDLFTPCSPPISSCPQKKLQIEIPTSDSTHKKEKEIQ